jgi:cell division protein FtsN
VPPPAAAAPTNVTRATGAYLVQIASQKSESDAQASFRAAQAKYASLIGTMAPIIKRADLGEKGVYYRAMVGPFQTSDEATKFCSNLKVAGGSCVVQRN